MSDPQERFSTALADRYRIERELGQGGRGRGLSDPALDEAVFRDRR